MRALLPSGYLLAFAAAVLPAQDRAEPAGRAVDSPVRAARELRDLAYVATDPSLKQRLDLYLPAAGAAPPPLVMFVHGGGWRHGDRAPYAPLARTFAAHGIACAAIGYRLVPDVPQPQQTADCRAALAWLVAHADEYGYDPHRIVLCGHSAGAHLVALLACDPELCGDLRGSIVGVVPLSGPYEVTAPLPLFTDVFGKDPEVRRDASPILQVTGEAPPFLVLWAENDMPGLALSGRLFAAKLQRKGVAVESAEAAGRDHISILSGFLGREGDEITARVLAFVDQRAAAAIAEPAKPAAAAKEPAANQR